MYFLNPEIKLTVKEVAEVLNIYEISAKELLESVIPFETEELVELALYKGVTLKELLLIKI